MTSRIRIVLVDDHELMREGLRAILEREEDVEVVGEAASGREAVAIAHTLQPHVVVMDVGMKDLNGIDATRQILSDNPTVRVIALSSHSDSRYVAAMLEAGACSYLLKANAYDDLRKALQAVRLGRDYLCAEVTKGVVDRFVQGTGTSYGSAPLSGREREVLQLLAEGLSSRQIGTRLFIATSTVETHRRTLMRKLGVRGIADLTKWAIREGLTELDG